MLDLSLGRQSTGIWIISGFIALLVVVVLLIHALWQRRRTGIVSSLIVLVLLLLILWSIVFSTEADLSSEEECRALGGECLASCEGYGVMLRGPMCEDVSQVCCREISS